MSRRSFLRLLGASTMLAGIGACTRQAPERIIPYTIQPEEITPGVPLNYATALELDGYGVGVVVESHDGRPTKIEGNPLHRASGGAAGSWEQAQLLQLVDPDRAAGVQSPGGPATWAEVKSLLRPDSLSTRVGERGEGLRIVVERSASPLRAAMLSRVRERWPEMRLVVMPSLAGDGESRGMVASFGELLMPQYHFREASTVLVLDADPLGEGPDRLRHASDIAQRRRLTSAGGDERMSRIYVAEPGFTLLGGIADHRLRVRTTDIPAVLRAIALELRGEEFPTRAGVAPREWVHAVARDLEGARGGAVVVLGSHHPAKSHSLAAEVNHAIGAIGRTVSYVPDTRTRGDESWENLIEDLESGDAAAVLVLGGNPAYSSPQSERFARALATAPISVYMGLYADETSEACGWMLPQAHALESWGDTRATDGTVAITQPLISPLKGGRTADELLALLATGGWISALDLLLDTWRLPDEDWNTALRTGVLRSDDLARRSSQTGESTIPRPVEIHNESATSADALIAVLRLDPRVHDGRFANNPWLQELPDPFSSLTWGNAALLSTRTAARLGVSTDDIVELAAGQAHVRLPVLIAPGHADEEITLRVGYGRHGAESVARGVGTNVLPLRGDGGSPIVRGIIVRRVKDASEVERDDRLAMTQLHWTLDGRPIIRETTPSQFGNSPPAEEPDGASATSLYPEREEHGPQWAMTIDLSLCTGCGACVTACQAENNIPAVGKAGVLRNREMHWIRLDRYFRGPADSPAVVHQPMLCQQCELAPCEYVCPVNATVHSPDGLNEMVYNRCVGTRFCSNNCPYKVRRFNWFDYQEDTSPAESLVMNPDVTVRERGVMEKCTFCVQRIRGAEQQALTAGAEPGQIEVRTACQQACPSRAIVFGNRADGTSEVSRSLADPRAYRVLDELGTRPRVSYLARVRNPNSAIKE